MAKDLFQISELSNLTGHTIRTIRYYMDEGLLPQPEIQGRYAYFDDSFVLRLKLIQRLKDAYLPLKEIKRILDALNEDQIKEYAEKEDLSELGLNAITPIASRGALDYIDNVMKSQKNRSVMENQRPQSTPSSGNQRRSFEVGRSSAELKNEGMSWRRIELRRGIELHIDEKIISAEGAKILSIIEHFKRVLRSEL